MHKNIIESNSGTESTHDEQLSSLIRNKLSGIRTSIDTIQERIDLASNQLSIDLPKINMEIYRTHNKALETWHLLKPDDSSGKIFETLDCMESILEIVGSTILYDLDKYSKLSMLMDRSGSGDNEPSLLTQCSCFTHEEYFRFSDALKKVQELQKSIIDDIESHLSRDTRSLENTLNTMIAILKDLTERSNLTKDPIFRIMSRLQIHDIIKQDMAIIYAGLSAMQPLEDLAAPGGHNLEAIRFWDKASKLSYNLITQVVSLIRDQCVLLIKDIDNIETTVSHIKEDKDHIAEFLLINDHGSSTFDITISEISEIMDSILKKIHEYESLKSDMKNFLSSILPSADTEAEYFHAIVDNTADTDVLTREFSEATATINNNLIYIKTSLIESIMGIDVYSKKCTESIQRFRQNIHDLIKALDISDDILDEMQTFTFCIHAFHKKMEDGDIHRDKEIESEALQELLKRLENPHSNTLVKDAEEELTLF